MGHDTTRSSSCNCEKAGLLDAQFWFEQWQSARRADDPPTSHDRLDVVPNLDSFAAASLGFEITRTWLAGSPLVTSGHLPVACAVSSSQAQ
jgi:hypothetical protein